MRWLAIPLMLMAGPAAAQVHVTPAPAPTFPVPGMPAPIAQQAVWNPAAPYITAGQDEPGYRSWYLSTPWRAGQVRAFNAYLNSYEVGSIVPTWQLLRTATSWQRCGGDPFEVPPTAQWPRIVQTLRYVRDFVVPAVGPVEPVSGYRNPMLNVCAGGAPESAHKHYSAIDMVPLRPTTREALMHSLCAVHNQRGAEYGVGLGFYAFIRFHVDTTKFRRWGADPSTHAACPPILRPNDVASVAQPLPPAPPVDAQPRVSAPSPERGQPQ